MILLLIMNHGRQEQRVLIVRVLLEGGLKAFQRTLLLVRSDVETRQIERGRGDFWIKFDCFLKFDFGSRKISFDGMNPTRPNMGDDRSSVALKLRIDARKSGVEIFRRN